MAAPEIQEAAKLTPKKQILISYILRQIRV